jgi:hypothetical protein
MTETALCIFVNKGESMNMKPMWASEREMCRLACNSLEQWVDELLACQDARLLALSQELKAVALKLNAIYCKSKSEQVAPKDIR